MYILLRCTELMTITSCVGLPELCRSASVPGGCQSFTPIDAVTASLGPEKLCVYVRGFRRCARVCARCARGSARLFWNLLAQCMYVCSPAPCGHTAARMIIYVPRISLRSLGRRDAGTISPDTATCCKLCVKEKCGVCFGRAQFRAPR